MSLPSVPKGISALLPGVKLPATLTNKSANLYQVLSRRINAKFKPRIVHQVRWGDKNIEGSYWRVTRAETKCEGTKGKAWGRLYWKGTLVSEHDERIPGALKYKWREGKSVATQSLAAIPPPPRPARQKT